jgi:hypothetical protein
VIGAATASHRNYGVTLQLGEGGALLHVPVSLAVLLALSTCFTAFVTHPCMYPLPCAALQPLAAPLTLMMRGAVMSATIVPSCPPE